MRVLLAIDGSPGSHEAVEEVKRRTWPKASRIRVISVVDRPEKARPKTWALSDESYERLRQALTEEATALVNRTAARFTGAALNSKPADALEIEKAVLEGRPKKAIVEEADRWHADLVVLDSHGYGAIEWFLLGSVSQAVVLHAPCSVEVVRQPTRRARRK